MKVATATITGVSPLSWTRYYTYEIPKDRNESHEDYERRTWKNKVHVTEDGRVFIPPTAIKNCISDCAKYLAMQIPGKGKTTYTKHFEAGLMCNERVDLGIGLDDVKPLWLHVPSDGKRGGAKRVMRCFPRIAEGWSGKVAIYVMDETILQSTAADKDVTVLEYHLETAGKLIGVGYFRPRNNGYFGRFKVSDFSISDI